MRRRRGRCGRRSNRCSPRTSVRVSSIGWPPRSRPAAAWARTQVAGWEGRRVGQYLVLELLGAGGMGLVYKAHDERLGRHVALKFLPPHLSTQPAAKQRFLVEARAAAALDHPNICTIHEIGETEDGQLFIAMPLYDGETLAGSPEARPPAVRGRRSRRPADRAWCRPRARARRRASRHQAVERHAARRRHREDPRLRHCDDRRPVVGRRRCPLRHPRLHEPRARARRTPSIIAATSGRSASFCTRC